LSVIPDRAEPAILVFLLHFGPYYLFPGSGFEPMLPRTSAILRTARVVTVAMVVGLVVHCAVFAVSVGGGDSFVDPVMAVSLTLVWVFLSAAVTMVWVYGLGVDAYLPDSVRRWRRFALGRSGKRHRRAR
jgi:hypothetical protein